MTSATVRAKCCTMLRPASLLIAAALGVSACSKVAPPAAPGPAAPGPAPWPSPKSTHTNEQGEAHGPDEAQPGPAPTASPAPREAVASDAVDPVDPVGEAKPEAPAKAAPPAFAVRFEGEVVDLPYLFAKALPLGGYSLYATSDGGSCEELLTNVFDRRESERSVLVTLGERLAPDGTVTLAVTDVWTSDGALDAGATVAVSGSAGKGDTLNATLEASVSDGGKTLIAIKGTATAKGCGPQAPETGMGYPKAPHPSTAKLVVAGKELTLVGARRSGTELLLSSGPLDCSPSQPAAQAVLSHRAGTWELTGAWFSKAERAQDKGMEGDTMPEVRLEPGDTGTSEDGPTVSLALSGAGSMGPYPVVLSGTIEALDCPP